MTATITVTVAVITSLVEHVLRPRDGPVRGTFLGLVVREDSSLVLGAPVVPLPVSGSIMKSERSASGRVCAKGDDDPKCVRVFTSVKHWFEVATS